MLWKSSGCSSFLSCAPSALVSGQGLVTAANTEWQVLTMLDFMVQLLELKIQVNR